VLWEIEGSSGNRSTLTAEYAECAEGPRRATAKGISTSNLLELSKEMLLDELKRDIDEIAKKLDEVSVSL
jgi:hypothetical protein